MSDDTRDPALARTAISQPGSSTIGADDTIAPQVIAQRYRIESLLGAGGMGRVYRARDLSLDEPVALKLLRRELLDTDGVVDRFRQEVKLARRVTSVHVVRTFDLGQHGDDHFLTMELIDGRSLARVLDHNVPPLEETLRVAHAACCGIAAAHAAGVLHRDLKPDNILVSTTGRIAITDFGIARATASPTTSHDRFAGTPAYMAPEQVDGRAPITPATDIYAFGAILFEMLVGRRPFVGNDPIAVAIARLQQPPPDPRSVRPVPDALAAIVLRCLAMDPAQRYADGAQLLGALETIRDLSTTTAPTPLPHPIVPAPTSLAIAVLPLRADAEDANLASGLTEEIVDALSMTRSLRVRPLASVRRTAREDSDPLELGAALGVDVVVDGTLRRAGDKLRISARATGVVDGFQLWANRFETRADGLLDAGDEIARAVARALTVELAMPVRAHHSPRATELYLEGKSKLRLRWYSGDIGEALRDLEAARALAPDDPVILATSSLALSRSSFFGAADAAAPARRFAERAVAVGGSIGESWLALGVSASYEGRYTDAVRALLRAVALGPGIPLAQASLGAIALEAGELDDAIAHLEAACALDLTGIQGADLARAYIYAGRVADGFALLDRITDSVGFVQSQIARFKSWRGELHDFDPSTLERLPGDFRAWGDALFRCHRTRVLLPADRAAFVAMSNTPNARLRASRLQFHAEMLLFVGEPDGALASIENAVAAGLQDRAWFQYCSILDPLRDRPAFQALAAIVEDRAKPIREALRTR